MQTKCCTMRLLTPLQTHAQTVPMQWPPASFPLVYVLSMTPVVWNIPLARCPGCVLYHLLPLQPSCC